MKYTWEQLFWDLETAAFCAKQHIESAPRFRAWLREEVSKRAITDPLCASVVDIESAGSVFYLGLDYDPDFSDIDELDCF